MIETVDFSSGSVAPGPEGKVGKEGEEILIACVSVEGEGERRREICAPGGERLGFVNTGSGLVFNFDGVVCLLDRSLSSSVGCPRTGACLRDVTCHIAVAIAIKQALKTRGYPEKNVWPKSNGTIEVTKSNTNEG